jgi:hypothetical protein
MQTIKRTVVVLDDREEITIETWRNNKNAVVTVKADYRGDEGEGSPMLVVSSPNHEMLDDDAKEITFATVEGQKTHQ